MVRAAEGDVPEGIDLFIPPWYDIFWSAVMFVALFWIFWKFVLPGMKKALDARSEGIEQKLEQAETERNEAHALLEQYREQLAEARSDAARIRAEAQAERQSIVSEARTEAQEAAAAVTERAEVQMTAEADRVRAVLSRDVGRLATDLAERIVGEALDEQKVSSTVDRFIADLETVAPEGQETR
ncbi:F0F1 ATP synthase subunit B [Phytoactinopolyspora alkaliphila]|uniref:ATP synthase subunit b n=2 Tax=Phytoactinopolyspora alkaliphila TaxID=1783498 RepID=A0A6N9YSV2_9ACTN|nr:F0F1 ATP synthase subunit B [Phytoactinopolyspora alkaliphila]NED98123.1 F0F1 ATP synthase subunit B [Phytoactinopolyspora alkaliphila]